MRTQTAVAIILSALVGSTAAIADIVPVTRTTTISASWYQSSGGPFPPSTGSASDGTTTFAYYANTIASGAAGASQTSYLLTDGAYARISASGHTGTSIHFPSSATGASRFTYVFDLTSAATLYFSGTVSRGSPFVNYGQVELFNDNTGVRVYNTVGLGGFETVTNFAHTYTAAAGRYRFVVSGVNSGGSGGAPDGASMAQVFLTLPSPGAAASLALGAMMACRRHRA